MNHFRPLAAALFAALVFTFTGCGPGKEDQPPKPKVTGNASAAESVAAVKEQSSPTSAAVAAARGEPAMALPTLAPAPQWQLEDVNGATISSDQFKGKVLVVDFWATWCPPCVREIPGYTELVRKHGKDGLAIVGMSIDEGGPDVVKKFAARHKVNYPLVMATQDVVAAFGGFSAIPTTFLVDREGRIRDRKEGAEETAEYEKKILALLR